MHDSYQLITLTDVKQDTTEILSTLSTLCKGTLANDLRLLNYYQSIPVTYGATVEHVDREVVELAVAQQQAVVMHQEKQVFLKSAHFPKDVVAAVSYVNIAKCRALVSKFAYVLIRAERRECVRVQVRGKTEAEFFAPGVRIAGQLFDISLSGIAITADPASPPEQGLGGMVTLRLPGGPFEVAGEFIRVVEVQGHRLCILAIKPDNRLEKVISQFIFQRQVEVIRELKDKIVG